MNTRKIVQLLILFVICNFCNQHFQAIGRHQWRCRVKVKKDVNEAIITIEMKVMQIPTYLLIVDKEINQTLK